MSDNIYTVPEKWRLDLFQNPTKSLKMYDDVELWEITHLELMTESVANQHQHNPRYGCLHSQDTKKIMSEYWINFYKTEMGSAKRKAVSEKNKKNKSIEMKKKWKTDEFIKKMKTRSAIKPNGFGEKMSEVRKKYWEDNKNNVVKKLLIEGVVYNDAFEAAAIYNIHPVNIRRRCRLPKYKEWSYL